MQLGFVSAIFGDLALPEVLAFAAEEGFDCVEVMCWPEGGTNRRYAGVTHIDVSRFDDAQAKRIRDLVRLYERGILGLGWHIAKIPGLGDVDWGSLFAALTDVGYRGAVCIEVEDRAYEGSLEDRKRALRQSKRFLEQFVS